MTTTKTTATLFTIAAAALVCLACLAGFATHLNADQPNTVPTLNGIAVVELFTSEGCSSCPPADQLIGQVVELAEREHATIYGLSFHVTYWDRLGWKDPFGDIKHSERQRSYALHFGNTRVYTPQAVVNGQWEFVGSDAKQMAGSIRAALQTHRVGTLGVEVASVGKIIKEQREIKVRINHQNLGEGITLNFAAAERSLSVDVKRGENSGRRLSHENVVRAFQTIKADPATTQSTATLSLPADVKTDNISIIVYAQRDDDRQIINAAATKPPIE